MAHHVNDLYVEQKSIMYFLIIAMKHLEYEGMSWR